MLTLPVKTDQQMGEVETTLRPCQKDEYYR